MDDPVKEKPYPTADDLRACVLTPEREAEARRRRNQPHMSDELVCALVNALDAERAALKEESTSKSAVKYHERERQLSAGLAWLTKERDDARADLKRIEDALVLESHSKVRALDECESLRADAAARDERDDALDTARSLRALLTANEDKAEADCLALRQTAELQRDAKHAAEAERDDWKAKYLEATARGVKAELDAKQANDSLTASLNAHATTINDESKLKATLLAELAKAYERE